MYLEQYPPDMLIDVSHNSSGVFDFYKAFIDFINERTGLQLEKTFIHYRGLTRAIGSFHSKHELHSIPICLHWTIEKILQSSKAQTIINWSVPDLNIFALTIIVPVINYHFEKSTSYSSVNKVAVDYSKYPPCITKLFEMKSKGNQERFEIIRYLFTLHPKSEVYMLLKMILSSVEYQKAKSEGQIEFILNREYPAPTCSRMMTLGLCTHCSRASPTVLRKDKK